MLSSRACTAFAEPACVRNHQINLPESLNSESDRHKDGNGVSPAELAQLVKGIGYAGEPDMFTIKPLQEESLLLTGICYHPVSQLFPCCSPTLPRSLRAYTPSNHVARTRYVHGRPVRAVAEGRSIAEISDNNSLSDSDSDASSDNHGCCSKDGQDGLSPRKHIP